MMRRSLVQRITAVLGQWLNVLGPRPTSEVFTARRRRAGDPALAEVFSFVDEVFCLTLFGQRTRQASAVDELVRMGLTNFRFIEGFDKNSAEVKEAFATGLVAEFPSCFRCGKLECGDDQCNNTLTGPQIGNFLSFLKMFRAIANGEKTVYMVTEDDIHFFDFPIDDVRQIFSRSALVATGLYGEEPVLIRLCSPRKDIREELIARDPRYHLVAGVAVPSNPCFIVNRAFAQLALDMFARFAHTSDNYIHKTVAAESRHYTLSPPIAAHKSAEGLLPHTIHPRKTRDGVGVRKTTLTAQEADNYFKHTKVVNLAVIGSPRCGTAFAASLFSRLGLDIQHEAIGTDGIASWLFAISDTGLPIGRDAYARNSQYVYPKTIGLVYRDPVGAVPSLMVENAKNLQSYAFRRKWISALCGVDLDTFSDEAMRAFAAHVYWYRICLDRKPTLVLRLAHVKDDVALISAQLGLSAAHVSDAVLSTPVHGAKKYLGHVFAKPEVDFDALVGRAPESLTAAYKGVEADVSALATGSRAQYEPRLQKAGAT